MLTDYQLRAIAFGTTLSLTAAAAYAAEPSGSLNQRHQDFSSPSGWEEVNSRNVKKPCPTIVQDFGYRSSNLAGGAAAGEIGGTVTRGAQIAYYAKKIPTTTLDKPLSASGTLFLRQSGSSSALMVGWFNADSRGWRTRNSLVFRLFGTTGYGRLTCEYGMQQGGMASYRLVGDPYLMVRDSVTTRPVDEMLTEGLQLESIEALTNPEKQNVGQPTAAGSFDFKRDGGFDKRRFAKVRPHKWELSFDPEAANGQGEITLVFDGHKVTLPLEPGHLEEGAVFNRFGIFNVMIESGGAIEAYLDDLVIDGQKEDFTRDPGWEAVGDEGEFENCINDSVHDFGYNQTNHVSQGAPGEIGGIMFRQPPWSYCADPQVGPLTLDDELYASGKVCFPYATSDSGVLIGWFNSETVLSEPDTPRMSPPNFIGSVIEGPSRVGHYHRATYKTATGAADDSRKGPLLVPDGKTRDFTLHYQPDANDGNGALTVTLEDESTTLNLAPGDKESGAIFDRFGVLNWQSPGGHFMEIYWDDLSYTVGKPAAE